MLQALSQPTPASRVLPSTTYRVLCIAGRVQLDELGLSSDACLPIDRDTPGAAQPIRYLHIFEDGEVSLGIFCLPKGACIPLHNHPGMTVFSRALLGRVHVLSFDWAEAHTDAMAGTAEGPAAPAREARRVLDCVMGSGDDPALLQPTSGGNIHQFTAVTDCAVLDLLTPPYSLDDGVWQLAGLRSGVCRMCSPPLPQRLCAPIPVLCALGESGNLAELHCPLALS